MFSVLVGDDYPKSAIDHYHYFAPGLRYASLSAEEHRRSLAGPNYIMLADRGSLLVRV